MSKSKTDPKFREQEFERLVTWLHAESSASEEISCGCILSDKSLILTNTVQHFPDTIGLQFSGYILTLTKDGHWFIESNDGG